VDAAGSRAGGRREPDHDLGDRKRKDLSPPLRDDPKAGVGARRREEEAAPLSLEWANSARDEDFEETVESATLGQLQDLSRVLDGEHARLQKLYGESPLGSRERRIIKAQIREVAAQSGSVRTSAMFHRDASAEEPERAG
jgi:hypothetical protein